MKVNKYVAVEHMLTLSECTNSTLHKYFHVKSATTAGYNCQPGVL